MARRDDAQDCERREVSKVFKMKAGGSEKVRIIVRCCTSGTIPPSVTASFTALVYADGHTRRSNWGGARVKQTAAHAKKLRFFFFRFVLKPLGSVFSEKCGRVEMKLCREGYCRALGRSHSDRVDAWPAQLSCDPESSSGIIFFPGGDWSTQPLALCASLHSLAQARGFGREMGLSKHYGLSR